MFLVNRIFNMAESVSFSMIQKRLACQPAHIKCQETKNSPGGSESYAYFGALWGFVGHFVRLFENLDITLVRRHSSRPKAEGGSTRTLQRLQTSRLAPDVKVEYGRRRWFFSSLMQRLMNDVLPAFFSFRCLSDSAAIL
jgi:hypothetical protein